MGAKWVSRDVNNTLQSPRIPEMHKKTYSLLPTLLQPPITSQNNWPVTVVLVIKMAKYKQKIQLE